MAEPSTNQRPPEGKPPSSDRAASRLREVPVAVGLVGIFGWLLLTIDDHIMGREVGAYVAADFWPRVLLLLGFALSVVYLARTVLAAVRQQPAVVGADAGDRAAAASDEGKPTARLGSLGVAAGLLIAYLVLMQILGFVVATLLFCVGFLLLAGERRWWMVVGLPVLTVAVVLATFTRLLVVPLPRGVGPFLEFSTWLY